MTEEILFVLIVHIQFDQRAAVYLSSSQALYELQKRLLRKPEARVVSSSTYHLYRLNKEIVNTHLVEKVNHSRNLPCIMRANNSSKVNLTFSQSVNRTPDLLLDKDECSGTPKVIVTSLEPIHTDINVIQLRIAQML
jgi:hypothetical protein